MLILSFNTHLLVHHEFSRLSINNCPLTVKRKALAFFQSPAPITITDIQTDRQTDRQIGLLFHESFNTVNILTFDSFIFSVISMFVSSQMSYFYSVILFSHILISEIRVCLSTAVSQTALRYLSLPMHRFCQSINKVITSVCAWQALYMLGLTAKVSSKRLHYELALKQKVIVDIEKNQTRAVENRYTISKNRYLLLGECRQFSIFS